MWEWIAPPPAESIAACRPAFEHVGSARLKSWRLHHRLWRAADGSLQRYRLARQALASGSIEQASGMGRAGSAPAEWYDGTWNPTGGCSPVSPGCAHCEALQTVSKLARIGGKGGARYTGLTAMAAVRLAMDRESCLQPLCCSGPFCSALRDVSYRFAGGFVPRKAGGRGHRCAACRDSDRALAPVPGADQARRPHASFHADPQTPYRIAVAITSWQRRFYRA